MTRFVLRLESGLIFGCILIVLLGIVVGHILHEDEISFSAKNEGNGFSIYLMSPRRNMVRQLTYSVYDVQFAWSPDGQSIAVTTERDNSPSIYLMNMNGQKASFLDTTPHNSYAPAWSPDGHSVVYVTSRSIGSTELAITNVDTGTTQYLTYGDHTVSNPTWSPDGKHIIFVSQPLNVVSSTLYDLNIETQTINLLTFIPGYYTNAVWSPNNRYLLFVQAQPKAALYILDSLSGQTRLLYSDNVNIYDSPSWSPDSRTILFTRFVNNYRGDTGIFELDVESCIQQGVKCIPQELALPLSIYLNPRWWPH